MDCDIEFRVRNVCFLVPQTHRSEELLVFHGFPGELGTNKCLYNVRLGLLFESMIRLTGSVWTVSNETVHSISNGAATHTGNHPLLAVPLLGNVLHY